ncbi:MAG: N-succinylarginine dihydrolase [Natronospirillum sp.]|uniref:N-succinylarginine dihydrolase n=1 Tax=Natronospirillum sp. TaxID=2812955 RepID=UPI0025FC35AB|nr:N-succinylarginine dihydrolase [Natronospirillum sp.]MCH8552705.1 N-succinylarginine dihydrolase [Natronospirillum sp.]
MTYHEVNFDGLVGPTHNYAGLSYGNIASERHQHLIASPKKAALQGLDKMEAVAGLGLVQGLLPPHERPHMPSLRQLGFSGSDAQVLQQAAMEAPALLSAVSSASAMWTANAATVSSSVDAGDGRVHLTAANLNAKFHRSIEHPGTVRALKAIFQDPEQFQVHDALPANPHFGDEGAANHTRLCADYGQPGVELYVYGREAFNPSAPKPERYPARQTLEASAAVARLHTLTDAHVVMAQQNPKVIDQGVFHNDVIAVGNRNVLFYHEEAFLNTEAMLAEIDAKLQGADLIPVCIRNDQLTVEDAVNSYLFNSQLISLSDSEMALVVPKECEDSDKVWTLLNTLTDDPTNPISQVKVMDLKQSMRNGGGPACLRLRVVLSEAEQKAVQHCLITPELVGKLRPWVEKHYRDELAQKDLADPQLLQESRTALDELTQILKLGSIYDFQL